ncbi:hypothetical protein A9E70_002574 [Salmonella enterica subsp. enterica serovar Hvittingfoss]|nr:hypothetical protein [Salmonella enterica]EBY1476063.1 hypothetical protein [Salmonella enterica subsp. enterica serovar Hvittingfoss]ECR4387228.1 hypothetical protein [Salmonella enterica subsp. enterica serovar Hvittingfoss]ECY5085661.1 hypothetical protein [Salmonella enterica subsp. enterica serovar Hvittingfoss]EDP9591119.1 hypothetical protein [Salmonella enterica subsp. enterica serovar Hvittingfoss]
MGYISQFEASDIDSDDIDLRFEVDAVETGTTVSIVDECGHAAQIITALLDELECKQTFQQAFFRQSLMYDVVAEAYEEAKEQIAKDVEIKTRLCLESNNLFDRLCAAEKRITELESKLAKPVLLPKTNGYWNEQEKAYEEAITLAKQRIRMAGFRCEGDE